MEQPPEFAQIIGGKKLSRRSLMGAGLAFLVAGCVRDPVISNAVSVFRHLTSGQSDQPIDRETVANVPYALVTAKIGKGPRAVLVLHQRNDLDLHWMSADKITLITRQGRIVKTAGLPENIALTIHSLADPLTNSPHELTGPTRFHRTIDVRKASGYITIPIESELKPIRPERIKIVGLGFDTILIKETCRARTANWRFENFYWVDAYDGFVWKSRQHVARDVPPITMEVLKPAG
ncbi:MAG: YjbF family lipoprotein [Sphingomonadales bacterium]